MNNTFLLCVFFIASILASIFINGLVLKFVKTLGIRQTNTENQIRWASTSKPSLGGISFFIVFLLCVAVYSLLGYNRNTVFDIKTLGLVLAATVGFLVGLADDAYNTKPILKFIGQFTCAVILMATGFQIHISDYTIFNYVFTLLWITGFMNSINMLDNMDAISSVASVAALIGMLIYIQFGPVSYPLLGFFGFIIVGLIGSLLGFLYYNWHPSKIYMGDTGSQFLGAVLAGLSILFGWNIRLNDGPNVFQLHQLVFPMLIFIVPLCDTITVSIRRIARRQSPFVGGKDHITHQLAFLGLRDDKVVLILMGISVLSLYLAYFFVTNTVDIGFMLTFIMLLYGILVFMVLQYFYNKGRKKYLARQATETKDV